MADLSLFERALLFYGTRLPNHPRKWWLHDRLQRMSRITVDQDIEVVRDGLRWLLNPSDFEHAGLFWLGSKDPWDLYHLRRLAGPGCVFFDIGANFGYYSLALAAALDRQCRVYAFEPNPKTYARLLCHIEWNGLKDVILPFPLGLSDREGTASLIERSDNSGASRIGDDLPGIAVELTTLDAFCAGQGIERLDAIKIDVEGLEPRVLAGGRTTLSRFKPAIIIEFWTTGLERAHSSVDEVAEILDGLGYKLFKPMRDRLVPISEPPQTTVPENVFCFHPDRPFPSRVDQARDPRNACDPSPRTIETRAHKLLEGSRPAPAQARRSKRAPEPPGLCLVGCGWWGRVHALALKRLGPRVRRFFASRTLEQARDFARRFDGEAVFADLEAALADPRVHAVLLALPHQLHAPAARAALAAGKHVLIEKPLALSAEEGRELVRNADESGLCLAVAEQYRLSPLVKAARQMIDRGELGRIRLVRAVAVSRHQPAQAWKIARDSMGGGVLLDVGIHYIDVLRYWFGEPESVWATTPDSRSGVIEGEESVVAVLSFPGGSIATLQVSWAAWGPADLPNFELFGERASLQFGYRRPSLALTCPLSETQWAERARQVLPWRVREYIDQFLPRTRRRQVRVPTGDLIGSRALIEDFLRAITTGTEPAVPGREGVRDLEVVQAAYQALESRPACR